MIVCRGDPWRGFSQEGKNHQVGKPQQKQRYQRPVVEEGEHESKDRDAEEGGGEEGGQDGEEERGRGLDERQGRWKLCQQRVEIEIIPGKNLL